MAASGLIKTIYNPHLLDKETLIKNFVVRKNVFNSIFRHDILNADMERPDNHLLITGQRGMGKTTLLLRLKYAVEDDERLNTWLIPIIFKENEYYIDSLFNLWVVVLGYLITITKAKEDQRVYERLLEDIEHNYDHPRYKDDKIAYEKFIFESLVASLNDRGKKLILFIDNFHEILEALNKTEKQVLRERLITCADFKIVAASATHHEILKEYIEPLYENFKKFNLGKLSNKEIKDLYNNLYSHSIKQKNIPTKTNALLIKQPTIFVGKYDEDQIIKVFRNLTNGVTRTLVILFDIIEREGVDEMLMKLTRVLDKLTPYFEQKINRLKPQSRKIFHTIAMNYDGISVKEITRATRLSSKSISSSLVPLVKSELIRKIETNTKNHLYIIQERFLNIWYLMRYGKGRDITNIGFLVHFFEEWRIDYKLEKLEESYERKCSYPMAQKFNEQDLFDRALVSYKLEDFQTTKDAYETLLKNPNWQKGGIYNNLGNVYNKLNNFDKAKENYEKAKELGEKYAARNLAGLYIKNNKFKEAYLKLIKGGDMDAANGLAWNYYLKNHAPKQALKYAKQAFNKYLSNFHVAHTYATVLVWNNKIKTKDILVPCKVFLQQLDKYKDSSKDIMDFLILLITKKRYDLAYGLFMNKEYRLRERYASIYYALMREEKMKKKYPNEYLKMGSEQTEIVEEIQEKIKEKRAIK